MIFHPIIVSHHSQPITHVTENWTLSESTIL